MSALNTFRSTLYFPNINNEIPEFGTTGPTGPTGPSGGTTGDTGPTGPTGAGVGPMQPLIRGSAFGETDQLGRTMLGYGVDNSSSNSIVFWSSGAGSPQDLHNNTMSFEAMVDTTCNNLTNLNSNTILNGGDVSNTNLTNTNIIARDTFLGGDWTENILLVGNNFAGSLDSVTRSVAILEGEFDQHPSTFSESILIGGATGLFSQPGGCTAGICILAPGSNQLVGLETSSCYIGNGLTSKVLAPSEFHLNGFTSFSTQPNAIPQLAGNRLLTYSPGSGEITQDTAENVIGPMQPQQLGLAYGLQTPLSGNSNNLGFNVTPAAVDSNIMYVQTFANPSGQTGLYQRTNLISDYDLSSSTTAYNVSNVISNSSTVQDLSLTNSIVNITNSGMSGTYSDSQINLNTSTISTNSTCQRSLINATFSTLSNSDFSQSVVIGSNISTPSQNFNGGIVIGDLTSTTLNDCSNGILICAGGLTGPSFNSGVTGSAYIGNKRRTPNETVTPGQFWASEYDEFYLRTLRNDVTPNAVYYDPVTAEVTYGSGSGMIGEMTSLIPGTAYGFQGLTGLSNILGRNSNESATDSTVLYNQPSAPTTQVMPISNSIVIENSSDTSNVLGCTGTTLIANNYISSVGDSFLDSYVNIRGQFEQPSEVISSIIIGSVDNFRAAGTIENSITIRPSNAGGLRVQQASESCFIGRGSSNRSIGTGEFWIDAYAAYYITGIRSATGPTYLMYNDTTEEITQSSLAQKLPTAPGGQFGVNSSANVSDVNGRDSFNNYSAGPVQLTGVSSVGNEQFTTALPGSLTFTNDILLGRSMALPVATSVSNSLIAANTFSFADISSITDSNMIVPKNSNLLAPFVGQITGANFLSSGSISMAQDPFYSSVISSGATVQPGRTNLILSGQPTASVITFNNGSGNTLIQSSSSANTYTHSSFSNCLILNNGASPVAPTANTQISSNHQSILMPNINAAGVADINTTPMGFNSTTGLISPTLSSLFSRVYRAVGTTTAGGQVSFTPGGSINPSTAGYSFTATVRNTSTTVAYTCSINAVTATTVTIQVFNSVTVVLASPSMTASGAGIVVHFQMAY